MSGILDKQIADVRGNQAKLMAILKQREQQRDTAAKAVGEITVELDKTAGALVALMALKAAEDKAAPDPTAVSEVVSTKLEDEPEEDQ